MAEQTDRRPPTTADWRYSPAAVAEVSWMAERSVLIAAAADERMSDYL